MSYRIDKLGVLATLLGLLALSLACSNPNIDPPPPPPPPPPELNYTVAGTVTEYTATGPVPVDGVNVALLMTRLSAVTDINGRYSLPDIKSPAGTISFSKAGFKPTTVTFTSTTALTVDLRVERVPHFNLSGLAYEVTATGRVPIAGIVLYCDGCGAPDGHTFVTTDEDGRYSFAWVLSGTTQIQIMGKEGYRYVTGGSAVSIPTPADTRFDFEFVRR
jgi:hypothetical protein